MESKTQLLDIKLEALEALEALEKYKDFLEDALGYYYDKLLFLKFYKKFPKSRYHSFKFALQYILQNNLNHIVELGTIRSFVDGRFEGCNMSDKKYWDENNPTKWDWSAGMFSRVFCENLTGKKHQITTVDINDDHISRCKIITKKFKNINYIHSSSEDYLKNLKEKVDVIYLDTGDMTPVEENALIQLLEVHLIVDRDLLNINGLIIIDDICNPEIRKAEETDKYGKSKYSIPYLLDNNFEIIFNEYQIILRKIN
jgi:hypothetical protein